MNRLPSITLLLLLTARPVTASDVSEKLSQLTPEEKAALIVGARSTQFDGVGYTSLYVPGAAGTTHPVERLGIPAIVMADGPAGVRIKGRPCTKFPIGTALSSSWNTALVKEVGAAIGNEVLEYGVDVLLAPGINIQRNPLCGRNFEYYSEDPLVAGKIAAAYVRGVQSQGVGTSVKHFAANNQELNRLYLDARVSPRALREIYLKNFEIAVREGEPWTVMTSYNYLNGVYAAENAQLVNSLLRGEWGYDGAVMTDWGGGHDSAAIVASGNDMIQPGSDRRYRELLAAMEGGSLPMAAVDSAVAHILRLAQRAPRSSGYAYSNAPDLEHNATVARKAAAEGMVLLKNAGATLPLAPGAKVALLGVASYDFITGGTGSGDVNGAYVVDLRQGLLDAGVSLDPATDAFYEDYMVYERERCAAIDGKDKKWYVDAERPLEAVPAAVISEAAASADIAVVTIGRVFGEGKDRSYAHSYCLSEQELLLIRTASEAFHKAGKKLIVVLDCGGIVEMRSWQDYADAILVSWLPGCEGGHAVADILIGAECPSGRLPMTVPADYPSDDPTAGDIPQILADKPVNYSYFRRNLGSDFRKRYEIPGIDYVNYKEGVFVGYRHYLSRHVKPAYPFGFGLSYTSFRYSGLRVSVQGDSCLVSVTVRNTGKIPGKEVVQLYVKAPGKDMPKPARELKAFAKTRLLAPGESVTVEMAVAVADLASFDEVRSGWAVEKGRYVFMVARDASTPVLRYSIRLGRERFTPVRRLFETEPLFIGDAATKDKGNLRLLYWNIQNGMWADQGNGYDNFVNFVREKDPDVCVWCEAKTHYRTGRADAFPADPDSLYLPSHWTELAARYGHRYVFVGGERDFFPQVITSRYPLEECARLTGDDSLLVSHGAGWARLKFRGRTLNLITAHTWPQHYGFGIPKEPASLRSESAARHEGDSFRKEEMEWIAGHTIGTDKRAADNYWMLLGDFNSVSRADNAVYGLPEDSPQFLTQDYLDRETPLLDAQHAWMNGEFVSTHGGGRRIDYIRTTKPLYLHITGLRVLRNGWPANRKVEGDGARRGFWTPSDHYPILVDFKF